MPVRIAFRLSTATEIALCRLTRKLALRRRPEYRIAIIPLIDCVLDCHFDDIYRHIVDINPLSVIEEYA